MTKRIGLTIQILLAAALITVSCNLPQGAGKDGSLTVVLPGGNQGGGMARSILPDTVIAGLHYRITLTGPGETVQREAAGGRVTVDVSPGTWTITVDAYNAANTLAGTGTETVTVVPGQPAAVSIKMTVDPGYAAGLSVYSIHNEAELRQYLALYDGAGKTALLENDISVGGAPAGTLTGTLDGQGHTITLGIAGSDFNTGLLGEVYGGGLVKNLRLEGTVSVSVGFGIVDVGAVTAINSGTIRNVSSAVIVAGTNSDTVGGGLYAGGIAGENNGTIQDCSAGGDVDGGKPAGPAPQTGGIAGKNNSSGVITQCYAWGNVTNNGEGPAGGIAGRNDTGRITRCAALNSKVDNDGTSPNNKGRIIGSNAGGTTTNNYAYENMQVGDPHYAIPTTDRVDTGIYGADLTASNLADPGAAVVWITGSSKLDWSPLFTGSPSAAEPPSGVSPWWWGSAITIDENTVQLSPVWPVRVPVLWFEQAPI